MQLPGNCARRLMQIPHAFLNQGERGVLLSTYLLHGCALGHMNFFYTQKRIQVQQAATQQTSKNGDHELL
jgi:hypothetical protein